MKRCYCCDTVNIISRITFFAMLLLLLDSGCGPTEMAPDLKVAICGMTTSGAVITYVTTSTTNNSFVVGEFEALMALPQGANCPQQWLQPEYNPLIRHDDIDGKHSWFVAGENEDGVGGTVYRFSWLSATSEPWFQLPPGDFVMHVLWTEENGWQALTIGGDPQCAKVEAGNEYMTTRCAKRSGILYLVNESGQYQQLVDANGTGRCQASFNPQGTSVAFRESNLCFSFADHELSSKIHIIDIKNNTTWTVAGDEQRRAPIWSPDGDWIAFEAYVEVDSVEISDGKSVISRNPEIQVVKVQNHQVHTLSSASVNRACALVGSWPLTPWSPDSQKLAGVCSETATGEGETTLEVFSLEDRTKYEMAKVEQGKGLYSHWMGISWSFDGNLMWKSTNNTDLDGGVEFELQDLEGRQSQSLQVNSAYNLVWPRWSLDTHAVGFIRSTSERDYLELFNWPDPKSFVSIELPESVEWLDLYWIGK